MTRPTGVTVLIGFVLVVCIFIARVPAQQHRLVANETEAAAILNQEQGRWSDLNRQLEELERLLVKR